MSHARLITLAIVGWLTLVGPMTPGAAAKSQVPFQATLNETVQSVVPNGTLVDIAVVGSGQASHLGKSSEVSTVVVDTASNPGPEPYGTPCNNNTRTVTLTAANGDQLTLALTGVNCDTGATSGITGISEDTYVVTGGTGRFAGATGGGTDIVYISAPAPGAPPATATTDFSGTLSTPGSL
jgi:hypothetical protein